MTRTVAKRYRRYGSWRLVSFFTFVAVGTAAFIGFISVALSFRSWQAAGISVLSLLVWFAFAAFCIRILGLARIPSVESDGSSWIRVYGAGSDFKFTQRDVLALKRVGPHVTVETAAGTFELTPDRFGYQTLRELIETWDPEHGSTLSRPNSG